MRTIPDHEFVLITRGSGTVAIEGRICPAAQGTLFYFHPDLPHSLESSKENPLCFYAFHFSYSHVSFQNGRWSVESGDMALPLKNVMEAHGYAALKKLMKELNKHWIDKKAGYQLVCNGLFLQFLHLLLENAGQNREDYASRLKVEKLTGYIHENYRREITVKELSRYANLSPDYLTSIFRSHTGLSPVKYINKYRIDAAKELLMHENVKVRDAALLTGFKDEFYFSRVFRSLEGISPLEFRRKISMSGGSHTEL
jgi:AraC-like DNA-binding protein